STRSAARTSWAPTSRNSPPRTDGARTHSGRGTLPASGPRPLGRAGPCFSGLRPTPRQDERRPPARAYAGVDAHDAPVVGHPEVRSHLGDDEIPAHQCGIDQIAGVHDVAAANNADLAHTRDQPELRPALEAAHDVTAAAPRLDADLVPHGLRNERHGRRIV